VVLAVLLATLFIGGVAGYAVRSAGTSGTSTERTVLVPRAVREGTDSMPFQSYPLIPRVDREGAERADGTR
jgi:hypothetical protein